MTVNIGNLLDTPSQARTTAHYKVAAFYRNLGPVHSESIQHRIARAVSIFDVEACLKDAAMKAKDGWIRAAEARLLELSGGLYASL